MVDRLDNTGHSQSTSKSNIRFDLRCTNSYIDATQHRQILDCEKVLRKIEGFLQESTPEDKNNVAVKTKSKKFINKLGNFGKSSLWPLGKQETMDLIGSLERHKNTFILTLSADTTFATRS